MLEEEHRLNEFQLIDHCPVLIIKKEVDASIERGLIPGSHCKSTLGELNQQRVQQYGVVSTTMLILDAIVTLERQLAD